MYSYDKSSGILDRKYTYAELYVLKKKEINMMKKRKLFPYLLKKDASGGAYSLIDAEKIFEGFSKRENFVKFLNGGGVNGGGVNGVGSSNNSSNKYPEKVDSLNTVYASMKIPENKLKLTQLESGGKSSKMDVEGEKIHIHSTHWLIYTTLEGNASINEVSMSFVQSIYNEHFIIQSHTAIINVEISTKNTNDLLNIKAKKSPVLMNIFELCNPEDHILSPHHEKLSDDDRKEILEKLGTKLTDSALPKIYASDRIVKYNHWNLKDVIKVVSKNLGMNSYMDSSIEYLIVI